MEDQEDSPEPASADYELADNTFFENEENQGLYLQETNIDSPHDGYGGSNGADVINSNEKPDAQQDWLSKKTSDTDALPDIDIGELTDLFAWMAQALDESRIETVFKEK
jgi:hypothetical protein